MIETMVVVVIIGITTSITFGKMHQMLVWNRIQRASTSVQNDLETAFTIAVRNHLPLRVSWSSSKHQMVVTNQAGTTVFRRTNLDLDAYGLRSGDVSFSSSPIMIYPDGLASGALTITISHNGITKHVQMSRTGMVLIQ